MATERSHAMILVGYFLSRCGKLNGGKTPAPPAKLMTTKWNLAYAMFYDALSDGRTLRSFANSLKNTRDQFDSQFNSGRRGWRGKSGKPNQLPDLDARVLRAWSNRSDDDLWDAVEKYSDRGGYSFGSIVLSDLESEQGKPLETVKVGFEGTLRAHISMRAERSPRLRNEALKRHGTRCQVCGFDYGEVYGKWGAGFIEVHHVQLLSASPPSGRTTDPLTDLVVLCANCHRMVHRKAGFVLSSEDLFKRIDPVGARTWSTHLEQLRQTASTIK